MQVDHGVSLQNRWQYTGWLRQYQPSSKEQAGVQAQKSPLGKEAFSSLAGTETT
jgi:hypothetical protein